MAYLVNGRILYGNLTQSNMSIRVLQLNSKVQVLVSRVLQLITTWPAGQLETQGIIGFWATAGLVYGKYSGPRL